MLDWTHGISPYRSSLIVTEYPPASEAMDAALGKSIDALRADVNRGFDRVEGHIQDMVTKGQFDATVQRLDARDAVQDSRMDHLDSKINQSIAAIKEDGKAATAKTRQYITWGLTVASLVSGTVVSVVSFFI